MNYKDLPVGQMIVHEANWLYRDSFNRVWLLRRRPEDYIIPIGIELVEDLSPPIDSLERILRKP